MSRYDDLNPPSDQLANPDDKHEVERTKLSLLRYSVETQDPSSKEVDDGMLRRFLRARDMDVEKASTMFLKYLKWKHSFLPNGTSSITTSDISTDISHNKVFLQGTDRTGRPICVAFGGRHFQNKNFRITSRNSAQGNLLWICSMEEGQEKFMAIGDLEGWGYANSDIRGYLAALHILQDYYPERLGKLFIVHVPYVFMAVWKVIYPFIDSNTKKKIVFVDNKKLKSTLLEDIDESQLPEIYGGKMPLVPVHEA
ncbi:SEC14 cytosolic factor [Linum perenne]